MNNVDTQTFLISNNAMTCNVNGAQKLKKEKDAGLVFRTHPDFPVFEILGSLYLYRKSPMIIRLSI